MNAFIIQHKNVSYRVSGSHGSYKIETDFLARTQLRWWVAVQNRFNVTQIKNDDCNHKSNIYFHLSEHQEDSLMEVMGELSADFIV